MIWLGINIRQELFQEYDLAHESFRGSMIQLTFLMSLQVSRGLFVQQNMAGFQNMKALLSFRGGNKSFPE